MERKEGYYWVKYKGDWKIASWFMVNSPDESPAWNWRIFGEYFHYRADEFDKINETRIPMPGEEKVYSSYKLTSEAQTLERAAQEGQLMPSPGADDAFKEQFEMLYGKPGDFDTANIRGVPLIIESVEHAKELYRTTPPLQPEKSIIKPHHERTED